PRSWPGRDVPNPDEWHEVVSVLGAGHQASSQSQRGILLAVLLLIAAVATDRFSINLGGLNLRIELVVGGLVAIWAFSRSQGLHLLTSGVGLRAVTSKVGMIEIGLLGWLAANIASSVFFSPDVRETAKFAVIIAGLITL